MSTIYVLIGFPGSGKSTWAKKKATEEEMTIIINRDSIRNMIKDKYVFDSRYEGLASNIAYNSMVEALSYNFDVIIDETSLTKKKRSTWRNLEYKFVGVWFTESEKNVEYRKNDLRGYTPEKWQEIIDSMKKSFEPPEENEFDELIKVNKV